MSLQTLLNNQVDNRLSLQEAVNKIIKDYELNLPRLSSIMGKPATLLWQYKEGRTKTCHIETAKLFYKKFNIIVKPFHEFELVDEGKQEVESCNMSAPVESSPVVENNDTTETPN